MTQARRRLGRKGGFPLAFARDDGAIFAKRRDGYAPKFALMFAEAALRKARGRHRPATKHDQEIHHGTRGRGLADAGTDADGILAGVVAAGMVERVGFGRGRLCDLPAGVESGLCLG